MGLMGQILSLLVVLKVDIFFHLRDSFLVFELDLLNLLRSSLLAKSMLEIFQLVWLDKRGSRVAQKCRDHGHDFSSGSFIFS